MVCTTSNSFILIFNLNFSQTNGFQKNKSQSGMKFNSLKRNIEANLRPNFFLMEKTSITSIFLFFETNLPMPSAKDIILRFKFLAFSIWGFGPYPSDDDSK
jgi:hypothetical protein